MESRAPNISKCKWNNPRYIIKPSTPKREINAFNKAPENPIRFTNTALTMGNPKSIQENTIRTFEINILKATPAR
ncbi:MAG: hypothetical protein WBI71_07935 [Methanothermobacter tenebrarum]